MRLVLDDQQVIRGAFRWIDAHWSYATGRGGAMFPPRVCQNFIALLDVYVRLRHGVPGADRLLQLVLDRVFDAGVPLVEHAFGSYGGVREVRVDGERLEGRTVGVERGEHEVEILLEPGAA